MLKHNGNSRLAGKLYKYLVGPEVLLKNHIYHNQSTLKISNPPKLPLLQKVWLTRLPLRSSLSLFERTVSSSPRLCFKLLTFQSVRDEFESKKADLEKQISDILGTAWTIDINPNAIYPYAEENSYASNSLGDCIAA